MRAIGIDIGSYSIKVAELEGQLKSMVVRDLYEFPLNHDPSQDLRLEKIEAIKKVVAHYDPKIYKFVVGLGTEFSTVRVLNFPFIERRKILQALPFELEDVIPFSQQDAIFDFRIIHQKESASKVLAIAVPKKYIQELVMLCEDAGLFPDVISLDGIALSNHFDRHYSGPAQLDTENTVAGSPTELVIHIGYTKTLIDVIQDKKLVSSRALYFGGRDLTNLIMRTYQLPFFDALKGVAEKSFVLTSDEGADPNQIAFSKVISQGLNGLVSDLQRTIVDLRSELQCDFTAAHLTGGMSRMINLGAWLSERLGMPVNIFEHLGRTIRTDVPVTEEKDKAFPIAIGLGVEAFRKPKHPAINLRKNEFSKQSQTLQIFFERYKNIAKIGAAFLVVLYIYSFFRASFTADNLTAVDKAIKDQAKNPALNVPSSQLKPESLKKIIKSKRDEIESKKQVQHLNQMNSGLDVMRQVSSALPQKGQITLDIRHFDLDNDKLTLEGLVNSKQELDVLQKNLAQVSIVNGVLQGTPKIQASAGKVPFLLSMNIVRLPPAEKKK